MIITIINSEGWPSYTTSEDNLEEKEIGTVVVEENRTFVYGNIPVTKKLVDGKLVDSKEKETEILFEQLRINRDSLLSKSDYKVLPDSTTTKLEEWKTYRQALRDLPANTSDPLSITWPTPPE